MDLAWASATVAITRAGGSTIAEQVEWEVPAILIPYPHAADGHQEVNADYVATEIGGGIKLKEKTLTGPLLAKTVQEILQGDVYAGMRQGLHQIKNRKRKGLAQIVLEVINTIREK
jgi:UDP-N-acetylglucosamine--N-acetylmuramyl-(pentapeptide) pyrophosphoryl-undecaprenol N-acetylglucosamine transferase